MVGKIYAITSPNSAWKFVINIRTIKSISFLWLSSLLGAGLTFLTQVILARGLGAEDFGVFSSALATVVLCVPLAGFGVASFWLKVFGEEGWKAQRWFRGSFVFIVLSTAIAVLGVVGWGAVGPHDEVMSRVVFLLAIYILGQLSVELVVSKFQLEEKYLILAAWQLFPHLSRFLFFAFLFFVFNFDLDVYGAALIYSLVSFVCFVMGVYILARMSAGKFYLVGHGDGLLNRKLQAPSFVRVGLEAWPFGAGGLFYLIYFQSAVIVLGYLVGPQAAGLYNSAFVVMAAIYLFPSVIYQKFLLPKIHRWASNDQALLYKNYRSGNFYMLLAGLFAMLVVWLFSFWGIPFLFGDDFIEAVMVLNVLAIAAPIRFVATSVGSILVTKTHMKRKVGYMGGVAVLNVVLNFSVIPSYGVLGAAIVTVVSDAVLLALYFFGVRKYVFDRKYV